MKNKVTKQAAKRSIKNMAAFACILAASVFALSGCDGKRRLENEESYRKIGLNQLENGNYESAVNAFNKALNERAGKVTALEEDINFYKAYAQMEMGQTKDAVETYTALIEYDKKNGDAYYLRGLAYLSSGNEKQAVEDFKQAVEHKKDRGELYAGIYEQLMLAGLIDEASQYLEQGLKIKGDDALSCLSRGRLYLASGAYDQATIELEDALKKEEPEANFYLGETARVQGDNEKAKEYYEAYAKDHAKDARTLYALGKIAFEKEDYEQAASYFQKGLECPDIIAVKSRLWAGKIAAMEHQGDFSGARREMEAYLECYPNDEQAKRECEFLKTR